MREIGRTFHSIHSNVGYYLYTMSGKTGMEKCHDVIHLLMLVLRRSAMSHSAEC